MDTSGTAGNREHPGGYRAAQARPVPGHQMGDRAIGTVLPQPTRGWREATWELPAPETARDIGIFSVAEHMAALHPSARQFPGMAKVDRSARTARSARSTAARVPFGGALVRQSGALMTRTGTPYSNEPLHTTLARTTGASRSDVAGDRQQLHCTQSGGCGFEPQCRTARSTAVGECRGWGSITLARPDPRGAVQAGVVHIARWWHWRRRRPWGLNRWRRRRVNPYGPFTQQHIYQ